MADRSFYEKFRQTPEAQGLLRMLRFAEGTERGGPDSYRVMFGGSLAPDLQRHPDKVMKGRSQVPLQVLINSCRERGKHNKRN
jgi:muramidase (phage lysozyme)